MDREGREVPPLAHIWRRPAHLPPQFVMQFHEVADKSTWTPMQSRAREITGRWTRRWSRRSWRRPRAPARRVAHEDPNESSANVIAGAPFGPGAIRVGIHDASPSEDV